VLVAELLWVAFLGVREMHAGMQCYNTDGVALTGCFVVEAW
jgi:hypothetical protein